MNPACLVYFIFLRSEFDMVMSLIINTLKFSYLKKSLFIGVLMLFLFNIGGYYIWFSYLKFTIQKDIRREIRSELPEKELTLISVPVNDESLLIWIKPGKEFTFGGKMYDVVKAKIVGDKKLYYCIDDVKEKKLLTAFSKVNEPCQKARRMLNNFHYQFVIQALTFAYIIETSGHDYIMTVSELTSKEKEVNIPPPKSIFQA